MKKLTTTLFAALAAMTVQAQGWEPNYKGVMLQAFYWVEPVDDPTLTDAQRDSIRDAQYGDMKFTTLTKQADELSEFFQLIWTPQSGKTGSYPSMGYDPVYWFNQNGTFGKPSEIRAMTAAFKERGTGIITDVVLNHRSTGSADWCAFPQETYNGKDLTYAKKGESYTLLPTDICANDDGGTTATWAAEHSYTLSANDDTGEDFSGFRDLDHHSQNTQRCVKAYLDYLLNNLGYTGFRLDMVKGYSGQFTGLYNSAVNVPFCVGEYWDSNDAIKNWMDATRVNGEVQSGAFDFQLKWQLGMALNDGNWQALTPNENTCLAWNSYWPRYAVTFVDNHDTGREMYINPAYEVAANAYILSMPGTPCVFLKHWMNHKQQIKQLIYARQYAGLTNQSAIELKHSSQGCVSTRVGGTLEILMGNGYGVYDASANTDMQLVESGNGFALYLSRSVEKPWISLPSGSYEGPVSITLTTLSNQTTDMVYTTDGSEPTAASEKVSSGAAITLNANAVLKVGLLVGGTVKSVVTRNYSIITGVEHAVNIFVTTAENKAPYLYSWSADGELCGSWPGTQLTTTETNSITGTLWYTQSLTTTKDVNIIFNNGNGKQTKNIEGLKEGNHYYYYDGRTTYQEVTADYVNTGEAVPVPTITLCVTTKGNAAPHLYAWTENGDELNGSWPGYAMTTSTVNAETGTLWWTLNVEADELNIILNNGAAGENEKKTSDITGLTEGTYYFYYDGGTQYEAVTADYVNSGSVVEPPLYILGEAGDNNWAANVGMEMTAKETGKYIATVSFKGQNDGYSYFSFTKQLGASASDWDAIASARLGAESNDYLVTTDNQPMKLQQGQNAFKIAAGTYGILVDLNEMTVLVGDPTIVGISTTAARQPGSQPCYTMQGTRVSQPTKGLYIRGGKKIMVR